MQDKLLNIYWQEQCAEMVPEIREGLKVVFPGLEPFYAGSKEVPSENYDPSRYQYDALGLLRHLPDEELSVWIIAEDIYHPGYRYLYGAALPNKAIVSSFRPETLDELKKEVCHEVGHTLGLEHCRGKCLMHVSRNGKELEKKPLLLCRRCQKTIEKMALQTADLKDARRKTSFFKQFS